MFSAFIFFPKNLLSWRIHKVTNMTIQILFKKYYEKFGLLAIFLFVSGFFGILNPNFFTLSNIQNIFEQTSINGLIAFGMGFVILIGGIDLSVGSVLSLTGYILGYIIFKFHFPVLPSILLCLFIGSFLGFLNGLLVSKIRLQPFIATLSTMTIFRGLTLVLSDGLPFRNFNSVSTVFGWLSKGKISIFPVPLLILSLFLLISWVLLSKTVFGRQLYATGGNEETAKLCTVPIHKIKNTAYSICGFFSALAAILYISRFNSIYPSAGRAAELDAIAAVVIGGTSMSGGVGNIIGTFVGALIIGVVNNGMNLIGVSSFYQEIIKGVIILFAVILDRKS